MVRKLLSMVFFVIVLGVSAQTEDYVQKPPRDYSRNPARNAAFIELGGNAGLYSLNFDRILFYRDRFKSSIRAGFAPLPHGHYFEQAYVLESCFILFKNPHHLELGVGATVQRRYNEKPDNSGDYAWENIWYSVWRCGYRYQPRDEGFFFRAGLTPVFMSHDALGSHPDYFQMWAGLSVGASF
ncbi:MAG: hypothetical protein JST26_02440 [Bacteroidetes bacterium]|nr:hypothetical protein [Bacteroidota bacterium]